MKIKTIAESAHFYSGIREGILSYIVVHGDVSDGIPEIVYQKLDELGHGNRDYLQVNARPHFLGWIEYYVKGDILVIKGIQSDVMEKLSNSEIRGLDDSVQSEIRKYRSRIDNRYQHWIDDSLIYIESHLIPSLEQPINSVSVELPYGLESGVRLERITSKLGRAGYQRIDQHTFQKVLKDYDTAHTP